MVEATDSTRRGRPSRRGSWERNATIMEPANAAGIQARKGSVRVAKAVPIAPADPNASTAVVPRGLGNPSSPAQPQAMTPADGATARATIAGPAKAVTVSRPARATTATVTRGCKGISGTGRVTGPAAARASARDTRVSGGGSGGASVTSDILPSPASERRKHLKGGAPRQRLSRSHRAPVQQDRGYRQDASKAGMRARSRLQNIPDLPAGEAFAVTTRGRTS